MHLYVILQIYLNEFWKGPNMKIKMFLQNHAGSITETVQMTE